MNNNEGQYARQTPQIGCKVQYFSTLKSKLFTLWHSSDIAERAAASLGLPALPQPVSRVQPAESKKIYTSHVYFFGSDNKNLVIPTAKYDVNPNRSKQQLMACKHTCSRCPPFKTECKTREYSWTKGRRDGAGCVSFIASVVLWAHSSTDRCA